MPIVRLDDVTKTFETPGGLVHAVNGVSLEIERGETVALIGESGSGKSTLGRLLLGLYAPDAGTIEFDGRDLTHLDERELRAVRSDLTVVFQEPDESLNPRMTIGENIAEPLRIHHRKMDRSERRERVAAALDAVSLPRESADRYPRQLSGGQQQRVGIARALMQDPEMILADEPVASLDPVLAHSILDRLQKLNEDEDMTILCSLHYLDLIQKYASRVIGLRDGRIVYRGTREEIRAMTDREFKEIYGEEAVRVSAAAGSEGLR